MRCLRRLSKLGASSRVRWPAGLATIGAIGVLVVPAVAAGDHGRRNVYRQQNLISDVSGVARITDPNLVNPWGMAAGPTTPLWIADNGMDVSTLYSGGVRGSIPTIVPLVVSIPGGAPTGLVFNPTGGFVIQSGGSSGPATFICDSEAGQITAWRKTTPPATTATSEFSSPTVVYKGLAMASNSQGTFLFATNFHDGTVDVFDSSFNPATTAGGFTDPSLPAGYAPFGI
jgi:uncharacterized protein (TIGR03118 family)